MWCNRIQESIPGIYQYFKKQVAVVEEYVLNLLFQQCTDTSYLGVDNYDRIESEINCLESIGGILFAFDFFAC